MDFLDTEQEESFELKINDKYAKAYEAKKKREELSLLEEKYGKQQSSDDSESSSSEEDEDEDGDLISPEIESQILKTISYIRKGNEKIYDSGVSFFKDEEAENLTENKTKKNKKIYMKDIALKELLEEGKEKTEGETKTITHAHEQKMLKEEFKKALENERDEDEEFFKIRDKSQDEIEKENQEFKEFLINNLANDVTSKDVFADWINGNEQNMNEEDKFLMNYVMNRGWVEKDKGIPTYDEIAKEDEENEEREEEFEHNYNFRFEDPNSNQIMTYPRHIEGSFRRESETRKKQRDARSERKEQERIKKTEEIKRLKNLKKEEIQRKLKEIQEISGFSDINLENIDLDGDFDPEKHDKQLNDLFNDEYYQVKEKIEDIGTTINENENCIEVASEKMPLLEIRQSDAHLESLEDYYKLDFEDLIGDLPTRFKYKEVRDNFYSFTPKEILEMDDKDLNQIIPLKKLAPYRDQKYKVNKRKRAKKPDPLTREDSFKPKKKKSNKQ